MPNTSPTKDSMRLNRLGLHIISGALFLRTDHFLQGGKVHLPLPLERIELLFQLNVVGRPQGGLLLGGQLRYERIDHGSKSGHFRQGVRDHFVRGLLLHVRFFSAS